MGGAVFSSRKAMKKAQADALHHEGLSKNASAGIRVPCEDLGSEGKFNEMSNKKAAKTHKEMEVDAKKMSEKYTKKAEAHLKKQRAAQKSCDKLKQKEEGSEKEAAAKRK